jgi:hypothetical protein
MLNDRLTAARAIAQHLVSTEADIESALVRSHQLAIAIVEGRQKARVAITIGQDSLAGISRSIAALVEARGAIAEAHAALAEDRDAAGLRTFGMGDVSECPKTASATVVPLHEQQVA